LCAHLITINVIAAMEFIAVKDAPQWLWLIENYTFCSSPMVQFLFVFKHPKRLHSVTELLGVLVVYFSWGCQANGRGDAVVFLRLLPARHGAAREQYKQ